MLPQHKIQTNYLNNHLLSLCNLYKVHLVNLLYFPKQDCFCLPTEI